MSRRDDERLTWRDAAALVVIIVVVVWLLHCFADALDAEAAFTETRLAAHRLECVRSQESVRLAEVTR